MEVQCDKLGLLFASIRQPRINYTFAIVDKVSSFTALRISALCRSSDMWNASRRSFNIFDLNSLKLPWARNAPTTFEYDSNSASERKWHGEQILGENYANSNGNYAWVPSFRSRILSLPKRRRIPRHSSCDKSRYFGHILSVAFTTYQSVCRIIRFAFVLCTNYQTEWNDNRILYQLNWQISFEIKMRFTLNITILLAFGRR